MLFAVACLTLAGVQFSKHGKGLSESVSTAAGRTAAPNDLAGFATANQLNLDNLILPPASILRGGPPIDGIPSITTLAARPEPRGNATWYGQHPPKFIPLLEAKKQMPPDDRVLAVTVGEQTRVYPFRVLIRHEIVNDTVGGTPILAVYCPLCNSVTVWERPLNTKGGSGNPGSIPGAGAGAGPLEFGVSGLLYSSNVLLYDRQTRGLWSQILMRGVSGPHASQALKPMTGWSITQLGQVDSGLSQASVMSLETGFSRDYKRRAYATYFGHDELMFPVDHTDSRLPNKTPVIGVLSAEGKATGYTLAAIGSGLEQQTPNGPLKLSAGNHQAVSIDAIPEGWQVIHTYWFAWVNQHPQTKLIQTPPG